MATEITIAAVDGSTRTTILTRDGTPLSVSYVADANDHFSIRTDAPDPVPPAPEPDPTPAPAPAPTTP